MEPLLVFAAEFWWVGPIAVGGGAAASVAAWRYGRRERARTLEYAASRHELESARLQVRAARGEVKNAQAAHLVARSARESGHGTTSAVTHAKKRVTLAQQHLRAAQTALKGRRLQVQGARATLRGMPRGAQHHPLPRLIATHDAVVGRWMEYETDAAKAIAFPAMRDTRVPQTSALLDALTRASWLRPDGPDARMRPEEFARYRSAVGELDSAFAAAEKAAWKAAGADATDATAPGDASGPGRFALPPQIREAWDDWMSDARTSLVSAASAAADAAMDAVTRARRAAEAEDDDSRPRAARSRTDDRGKDRGKDRSEDRPSAPRPTTSDASGTRPSRVWPVPRRSAD